MCIYIYIHICIYKSRNGVIVCDPSKQESKRMCMDVYNANKTNIVMTCSYTDKITDIIKFDNNQRIPMTFLIIYPNKIIKKYG